MRRPNGETGLRVDQIGHRNEGEVGCGGEGVCFVLVFHRWSASALAGALAKPGFNTGNSDYVVSLDNPQRFCEHTEFRAVNEAVLSACCAAWWGVRFKASALQACSEVLAPVRTPTEILRPNPAADWVRRTLPSTRRDNDSI